MCQANYIFYLVLACTASYYGGNASYILNVRVHSYSGDSRCAECYRFLSPGCCDNFDSIITCEGVDRCDTTIFYCLREYGTVPSQSVMDIESCMENDRIGMRSGINIDNQQMDFTQENVMGLSNPIPLFGITQGWKKVQLFVEASDADYSSKDELIDRFSIDIDQIPIGEETAPMTYNGTFGFMSLVLSFTANCFISHYYPFCEPNGCQNYGNCSCIPGYGGPYCDIEINECEDADCTEGSVCVDGIGSYTCKEVDSLDQEPLQANVSTHCAEVNCSGNGRCMADSSSFMCVCEIGYTGELCETIIRNKAFLKDSSHLALCIVALLMVLPVVLVIFVVQFVMIRTRKREREMGAREPTPEKKTLPGRDLESTLPAPHQKATKHINSNLPTFANIPRDQSHPSSNNEKQLDPTTYNSSDNHPNSYPNYSITNGPTTELERNVTTDPTPRTLAIKTNIRQLAVERGAIATESMFDSEEYSTSDAIPTKANSGYNCSLDHSASAVATTSGGPTPEREKCITTVPNQIRPSSPTIKTNIRQLAVERGAIATESMFDSEEYSTSDAIPTKANSGYNCSLDHSASAIATTNGGPTPEREKYITTVPNQIRPSSPAIRQLAVERGAIATESMFDSEEYSTSDAIPTKANSGYNCSLDHSASAITTTNEGPTQECEKYITTVPNQIRPRTHAVTRDATVSDQTESVFENEEYATSDAIPTKANSGYNCPLVQSARATSRDASAPTPEEVAFMSTWTGKEREVQSPPEQSSQRGDFSFKETPV